MVQVKRIKKALAASMILHHRTYTYVYIIQYIYITTYILLVLQRQGGQGGQSGFRAASARIAKMLASKEAAPWGPTRSDKVSTYTVYMAVCQNLVPL